MKWVKIKDEQGSEFIIDLDSAVYFVKNFCTIGFIGSNIRMIFDKEDNKDYKLIVKYFEDKIKDSNA